VDDAARPGEGGALHDELGYQRVGLRVDDALDGSSNAMVGSGCRSRRGAGLDEDSRRGVTQESTAVGAGHQGR